jgi:nucleotide-binding universal stress UspA family protein
MSFSAFFAVVLAVNLTCAVIAAAVAARQGRDPFGWVLVCAVLGPFGLIALFALRPDATSSPAPTMPRGEPVPGGTRVLVPVDGSDQALAAVRHAAAIPGARITLLTVLPLERGEGAEDELSPRRREMEEEANAHLQGAAALLTGAGLEFQRQIAFGDPAQQIVELAREGAFSLIVVGRHGRGALARKLLGSVSEAVVKNADTPVTVAG